jgi:hypothetical protein
MDRSVVRDGQLVDRSWVRDGQLVDRSWVGNGLECGKIGAAGRQELGKRWTGTGKEADRS